jgi:hypothetical protein
MVLSNYPPCCNCGHEEEEHVPEHEASWHDDWYEPAYCGVEGCNCEGYEQYPPDDIGPDPDAAYDLQREEDRL